MSTRESRKIEFNELKDLFDKGLWDSLNLSKSELARSMPLTTPFENYSTKISIHHESCVKTICEISEHPLVLVFSSAKNPGGGVANGATAQEEDLSLCSSWYFQAGQNKEFYLNSGINATYTDKMLYVSHGLVFKNEHSTFLNTPKPCSFIGIAAPNINGLSSQKTSIPSFEIKKIVERRILNLLKFAQQNGHKTLILGAWGTGVFGLDTQMVAQIFQTKIEEVNFDGTIHFSIPDTEKYEIFKSTFKQFNKKIKLT